MKTFKTLVAASAIAVGLLTAPAFAQDGKPADTTGDSSKKDAPQDDGSIVVTGSRLRHTNYDSAAPITIVRVSDELDQGKATARAVLQSNAITGGNSQVNNAYSGYIVDGGPGVNTLGLRGLGATRTLVLLNGHRLAPAGVQGAVDAVDLNTLPPLDVIDQFEILRDGASSIYGSDAVAGVVNVITRKKVAGFELSGADNVTTNGGGSSQSLSLTGGYNGKRLNLVASLGWAHQNALTLGDLSWAQCQVDGFQLGAETIDPLTGKPKCYPATGTGDNGVTINTLGTSSRTGQPAPGATGTSFNRWRPNAAVTTGLVGFEGVGGGTNGLNVRDTFDPRMLQNQVWSPSDLYTGFVSGSYDLQALGNAEIYFSALVHDRESSQTGFRQLSLDYVKGSPLIPAALAFSTFLPAGGSLMTNGQATGVRAFIGAGQMGASQSVRFFRLDGGIKGQTGIGDWRYDLYLGDSWTDSKYSQQQFLTNRLAQSMNVVANGSGFSCVDPSNGCVAAPVLTPAVIGGQLPAAWLGFVQQTVTGTTTFDERTVSLSLDGTLVNLPAGPAKSAFGAEYSFSRINDTPPADSISGNLYNYSTSAITRGSDEVISAFGEIEMPLLRNLPLMHELKLNGSGRFTHYRSYGDGWTYKVNGSYLPTGWLTLRSTYGTSYRAPSLKEQYLGATAGFVSQNADPCNQYGVSANPAVVSNCQAQGLSPTFQQTQSIQVNAMGGAASGLHAETSTNFTAGVVLQPPLPTSLGTFKLSIDYYNIKIKNAVDRAGYAYILNNCYDQINSIYCRLVTRNPANNSLTVNDSYINVASQQVRGIDFQLTYNRQIGSAKLSIEAQASDYLNQPYQLFPDQSSTDYNGTIGSPKWTGAVDTRLKIGKFTFYYGISYVSATESYDLLGLTAGATKYKFDTPDYFLHSASITAKFDKFDMRVGVSNLFDTAPPLISSGYYSRVGNAPIASGYDYFGRSFFVNFTGKF